MQYLGHTNNTKKIFVVCLTFQFNWVPIFSFAKFSNPTQKQPHEAGIIILILNVGKISLRETKQLAQSHSACKVTRVEMRFQPRPINFRTLAGSTPRRDPGLKRKG